MVFFRKVPTVKTKSNISIALYSESGSMGSTFVKRAQNVLQRVANVASDLREHFPVPEQESMNGISRVSGYMNLFYHQVGLWRDILWLPLLILICSALCLPRGHSCLSLLRCAPAQMTLRWRSRCRSNSSCKSALNQLKSLC